MRFEFDWGVPNECITWLWLNVGVGNITYNPEEPTIRREKQIGDAWFYERIRTTDTDTIYFVPTITVIDEKKAMMFSLRWL